MNEMEFGKPPVLVVGAVPVAPSGMDALRAEGIVVETAGDGAAALRMLADAAPRVLLVGETLPDMSGTALLRTLAERGRGQTAVLVISGDHSPDADRVRGAYDFLVEPVGELELVTRMRNACERAVLRGAVEDLSPDMGPAGYFGFIGRSLAMRSVYRMIESVARSGATVFITGEPGTGKAVCARAIHQAGPRANSPFVRLDCAALPPERIEAEIFGHAPGMDIKTANGPCGAAGRADGGTLFVREISDLNSDLQAKFLHFLQTGRIMPVGGEEEVQVNVRVICATDRDPMGEVAAGRFRQDLFYRLHVLPIHLPPLRERDGDAVEIAARMLREAAAEAGKSFRNFTPQARTLIAAYDWPGNVRELQSVIHGAVADHDGEVLGVEMLPDAITGEGDAAQDVPGAPEGADCETVPQAQAGEAAESAGDQAVGEDPQAADEGTETVSIAVGETLAEMERVFIEATIDACDGSLPRAARVLGVSPSTLYRKRESWGESR